MQTVLNMLGLTVSNKKQQTKWPSKLKAVKKTNQSNKSDKDVKLKLQSTITAGRG